MPRRGRGNATPDEVIPPGQAVVAAAVNGNGRVSIRQLKADDRRALQRVLEKSINSRKVVEDALTAAAIVLDLSGDNADKAPQPNAVTRTWQHAAWGYTHTVPELNAAKLYVGNALSRCDLVVGKRNPDGTVEQGMDGDEPAEGFDGAIAEEATDIIHTIRAPRGGQTELLRSFGEKNFVTGELYIVPQDTPSGLVFEPLSTQELMREGNRWVRYLGPGFKNEPLPPDTEPIRIWRPDSQWSMLADSSVRSCLEILEELVILTRLVRASAISRMALAGLLLIPEELDFPQDEEDMDGDLAESRNPLAIDMVNTGAKAIEDPSSAAAWQPFIIQGAAEFLAHVRHIPFQGDDQEKVIARREALERLAQGLDLPVEVILGHQQTTFANAAQISEDTFKLHLEPALSLFCDALTTCVLWPAMAKTRGIDIDHLDGAPYPDDILTAAVTFDASKLISRPDRSKDMVLLYTRDFTQTAIGRGELRESLGLDPEGYPDDEEVAMRIDAYRLAHIRETIAAPAADAAVPIADASAKAPIPGQSAGSALIGVQAKNAEDQAAIDAANVANGGNGGNPDTPAVAASGAPELDGLAYRIAGAAEFCVDRSVERVGARLRSEVRGRPNAVTDEQRQRVDDSSNECVSRALGPEKASQLLGRDRPFEAEIAAFLRKNTDWLIAEGFGRAHATRMAEQATALVAASIHQRLYADPAAVQPLTPLAFAQLLAAATVG